MVKVSIGKSIMDMRPDKLDCDWVEFRSISWEVEHMQPRMLFDERLNFATLMELMDRCAVPYQHDRTDNARQQVLEHGHDAVPVHTDCDQTRDT